ncbi:integrase [Rhizomicrobium palustre]|uniref:Integrase n=1 Tax=Rhizomicrobium palustre TaxID=189966 RepID=A0A846MVL9_9PROT|nr:site-specific integrase [Rhizomicrobium palustre]NIK87598.1 integrase [Rhizomicrobium palustre]
MVDAFQSTPTEHEAFLFDDQMPGFGIRKMPSGVSSWIIQYRNSYGRTRRMTLGRVGVLAPDQARLLAKDKLTATAHGSDPSAERTAARKAITVTELCDQYLEAAEGRFKESTLLVDRSRIECHVKPLLGTRAVASLTALDIEKFLRDVEAGRGSRQRKKVGRGGRTTGGQGVASRTVSMLGTILQRAVRDGILPTNPVRGVKRPKDKIRKPPFSFEALARVGTALREAQASGESETAIAAIHLLALTGLRRMEALSLRWEEVDFKARCLRLSDTKTGPQIRPIGRAALDLLNSLPRYKTQPYVFPSRTEEGHFIGLPHFWDRMAKRAGVKGVTLHGLRHWFASAAAELNYSELTIAGLLGHSIKSVTARYATAPDSALLSAADRTAQSIGRLLGGSLPESNVIDLERNRTQ